MKSARDFCLKQATYFEMSDVIQFDLPVHILFPYNYCVLIHVCVFYTYERHVGLLYLLRVTNYALNILLYFKCS